MRAAGDAARAGLQSGLQVAAGDMQCRHDTGSQAYDGGDDKGEEEGGGVEGDGVQSRELRGAERDDGLHPGDGDDDAERAAKCGYEQTFRDELTENATPQCAERAADCELTGALPAAREHQVDDIDAGDG